MPGTVWRRSQRASLLLLVSAVAFQIRCVIDPDPYCENNPLVVDVTPTSGVAVGMDVTLTAREFRSAVGVDWSLDPAHGLTSATFSTTFGTSTVMHPQAAGTYVVVAHEAHCGNAQATVTVNPDLITSVDVTASASVVPVDTTVSLTATVHASGQGFDPSVTWDVSPPVIDALSVSGNSASFRTNTHGDYVVRATSVFDSAKHGEVTITVQRPVLSISVVAPPTAEVNVPIQLQATLTKSIPQAPDRVTWRVSPNDAVESLIPTGDTTATLIGKRPHAVLTVTATSSDAVTSGSATIELTSAGCMTELSPLGPVATGDHLVIDGRIPIVVDPTGFPIVGSIEADSAHVFGTSAYVRRATSSGWEILGGLPVLAGTGTEVDQLAMATDGAGNPVVALAFSGLGAARERVDVQRWDGTHWVDLGIASGSSTARSELSLAVDASDHPLVVWQDQIDETKAFIVSRWESGTSWSSVVRVPAQLPDGTMRQPQLVLDSAGVAVLSWDEAASDGSFHRPWAVRLPGATPTSLGSPDPTGMNPFTSAPSVAIDGSGHPVIAWLDYPDTPPNDVSDGIRIHRFGSGTSWTELDALLPVHLRDESTAIEELVWSPVRSRLAVTTVEGNLGNGWIHEYDGNTWGPLCSALVDQSGYAGPVFATGLAADSLDGYWVAGAAGSTPDSIFVQRIRPAISPLAIFTRTLPDAPLGQPYDQTLQASGGAPPYRWTLASPESTLPPGVFVDPATGHLTGTPRLAGTYRFTVEVIDQLQFFVTQELTLSVTSCTEALPTLSPALSGNWFQILGRVPIAVDPQGRPVLAWVEYGTAGYDTHVVRLEGGVWVELGGPLPSGTFTNPAAPNVALALAADGTPYVAHLLRNGTQDDIFVSYLVSGAWQSLPRVPSDIGQGGFALAIDPAQRPVVAFVNFRQLAPFREIALVRLENGMWNPVPGIAHTPGAQGLNPAVAIDGNGTRYVAWDEQFVSGQTGGFRPYALKVDGAGAGELGTPNSGFDLYVGGPAIGFDDAGELVMAWADYPDLTPGAFSLGVRVDAYRSGGWVALGDLVPGKAGGPAVHDLAFNATTHQPGLSSVYSTRQPDDFIAGVHEFDGSAWHSLCDPIPDPSSASGRAEGLANTGLAWDPVGRSYVIAGNSNAQVNPRLFVARVHP